MAYKLLINGKLVDGAMTLERLQPGDGRRAGDLSTRRRGPT